MQPNRSPGWGSHDTAKGPESELRCRRGITITNEICVAITDLLIQRITQTVPAASTEGKGKGRGSDQIRHGCRNQHFFIPLLETATQELVEIWLRFCKSHSLKINDSLSFQLNFNLKSVTGANQHSSTCVSDLC